MSQLDLIDDGLPTYTGERDALDRYYTPPELLHPLIHRFHCGLHGWWTREDRTVLEPCAGRELSLARELSAWGVPRVLTADLDPGAPVDLHVDALEHDWSQHAWDIAVTNPPFAVAPQLIRRLLHTRPRGHRSTDNVTVAALLRLTFLEPCRNRIDLVSREHMERAWLSRVIVLPRVSFRGEGSDSVTCAWFVWKALSAEEMHCESPRRDPAWSARQMRTHMEVVSPAELERARIAIASSHRQVGYDSHHRREQRRLSRQEDLL